MDDFWLFHKNSKMEPRVNKCYFILRTSKIELLSLSFFQRHAENIFNIYQISQTFFSEPAFLWLEQLWCSDQDWSKCQMGSRQRKGILLVDQKAWKRSLLQSFQTLKAEVKESAGSEDQILLANQMQESHEDPK